MREGPVHKKTDNYSQRRLRNGTFEKTLKSKAYEKNRGSNAVKFYRNFGAGTITQL